MNPPVPPAKSPRLVTALTLCAVLVAVLTSRGPPLAVLDAILFSYYNNTIDPRPLMYFNGWIHLVPELVAWLVRRLPAIVQAAVYIVVAFGSAFIMQRELQKLLALWFGVLEAAVLAVVVLVYFQLTLPVLHQLAWCVWPLAVAACCHILRRNLANEVFSWPGLAATALACLTNPTSAVSVPPLVFFALTTPNTTLRRQNLALALLVFSYFAAMAAFKPVDAHYLPGNVLIDAARAVWQQLRAPLWRTAPVVLAVLALMALAGMALLKKRNDPRERRTILVLAYLGFSSLALFLFSGRAAISSGLPPRYTIICTISALLVVAVYASGRLDHRQRRLMVTAVAIVVCLTDIVLLAVRLPVQWRLNRDQVAFVRAIDGFRGICQPGEALARNPKPPGFAILCKPIDSAATAALPVVRRDAFGNEFAGGPAARLWRSGNPATIELLSPRR